MNHLAHPVMCSLILLCKFATFTYYVIYNFISVTAHNNNNNNNNSAVTEIKLYYYYYYYYYESFIFYTSVNWWSIITVCVTVVSASLQDSSDYCGWLLLFYPTPYRAVCLAPKFTSWFAAFQVTNWLTCFESPQDLCQTVSSIYHENYCDWYRSQRRGFRVIVSARMSSYYIALSFIRLFFSIISLWSSVFWKSISNRFFS